MIKIIRNKKNVTMLMLSIFIISVVVSGVGIAKSKTSNSNSGYNWIRLRVTSKTKAPEKANPSGEKYSYGYTSFIAQKSMNGIDWITDQSYSNLSWNINAKEGVDKTGFNQLISLNKISDAFNINELEQGNIYINHAPLYTEDGSGEYNTMHCPPYTSSLLSEYYDPTIKDAGDLDMPISNNAWIRGYGECAIESSNATLNQNYFLKKNDKNNNYNVNLKTYSTQYIITYISDPKSLTTNISLSNDKKLNLSLTDFFNDNRNDGIKHANAEISNNGFLANTQLVIRIKPKVKIISKIILNNSLNVKTDFNFYNYVDFIVNNKYLYNNMRQSSIDSYVNGIMFILFAHSFFNYYLQDDPNLAPNFNINAGNVVSSVYSKSIDNSRYTFSFSCNMNDTYYWFSISFDKANPNSFSMSVGTNEDIFTTDNLQLIKYFDQKSKFNLTLSNIDVN